MFAADKAFSRTHREPLGGSTVVLANTYSKVWVTGDDKGPERFGKINHRRRHRWMPRACVGHRGLRYGRQDEGKPRLPSTRAFGQPGETANNSYMRGGFALATLTDKGNALGPEIALQALNGDRTLRAPLVGFIEEPRRAHRRERGQRHQQPAAGPLRRGQDSRVNRSDP